MGESTLCDNKTLLLAYVSCTKEVSNIRKVTFAESLVPILGENPYFKRFNHFFNIKIYHCGTLSRALRMVLLQ